MRDEQEQRFADVVLLHRFNSGLSSPTSDLPSSKTHVNGSWISRDALFPYIARNLLLAKIIPYFGTFTNKINNEPELDPRGNSANMDLIIPHRSHRTRTDDDHEGKTRQHHHQHSHHHHHHHSHKSDGELEKERLKARLRSEEKDRAKGRPMERSSSDRGELKVKKHKEKGLASDRIKRDETDQEKEERRRRRKERKDAAAFAAALSHLDSGVMHEHINDAKGHKSPRRESKPGQKEKAHEFDPDGTLRLVRAFKQIALATKEKDVSKVSTRPPRTSSRAHATTSKSSESKQRVKEPEKRSERPKSSGKEKEKEKEKAKEVDADELKNPRILGFILEKKEKM